MLENENSLDNLKVYVTPDDAIERYLTSIERCGFRIEKYSDKIIISRNDRKSVTISVETPTKAERNIRAFMRGLPQPIEN